MNFCHVLRSLILVPFSLWTQDDDGFDIATLLKAKYPIQDLSQKQMYEDFDYLYYIFKHASPQIEIRENVTNTDILIELSNLRKEIDTISDTKNFILLIYRALRLSMDSHCQIGTDVWYWQNYHYKKDAKRFDEESFGFTLNYEDIVHNNIISLLNLKYINGKYYNIFPIKIYFKRDSAFIPQGAEVISLNNLSVSDYIYMFKDIQYDIRWDFENKCYYANSIQKYSDYKLASIQFKFINDTILIDSIYNYFQEKSISSSTPRTAKCVEYLEHDSILYIRCPYMSKRDIKFYRKQIRKHRHSHINKAVIDIRGNYGGNDEVWISILKNIIKRPIKNHIILVSKNLQHSKQLFPGRENLFNKKNEVISFPLASNTEFNVISKHYEVIKPSLFSIRYPGSIYIIQDEDIYSAAGSLSAMALYSDKIINVGVNNGQLGGRGLMPAPFRLPNSKLIFLMNFTLDVTNAEKPEDIYRCKVESPVTLSPQYYIYREKYLKENSCSKSYLYNQDDIFKKVISVNQ